MLNLTCRQQLARAHWKMFKVGAEIEARPMRVSPEHRGSATASAADVSVLITDVNAEAVPHAPKVWPRTLRNRHYKVSKCGQRGCTRTDNLKTYDAAMGVVAHRRSKLVRICVGTSD